jgi:hypothetical protein
MLQQLHCAGLNFDASLILVEHPGDERFYAASAKSNNEMSRVQKTEVTACWRHRT